MKPVEQEVTAAIEAYYEATGLYPRYVVLGLRRYEALRQAAMERKDDPRGGAFSHYRGCALILLPSQDLLDVTVGAPEQHRLLELPRRTVAADPGRGPDA